MLFIALSTISVVDIKSLFILDDISDRYFETFAALEREGSRDQSAQPITSRPNLGQLQQVGKTDSAGIKIPAPSPIDPLLTVQPDNCYINFSLKNTYKYYFINYRNIIHLSLVRRIRQTLKTKPLIMLLYN